MNTAYQKYRKDHQAKFGQHESALLQVTQSLLPLVGIPCPKVEISWDVHHNWENTIAVAYSYNLIQLNPIYLNRPYEFIVGVMKHELVHNWMHYHRLDPQDSLNHGTIWRQKALEIGAFLSPRTWTMAEKTVLRACGFDVDFSEETLIAEWKNYCRSYERAKRRI